MGSGRRLGELCWPQVRARRLLMPVGSTEQHGPHLPLDTDTRIALAVAERAAATRPDLLVAPPLAFGASGEHAGFPGTLSLGTDVLAAVVVELARSSELPLVVVNGHGGNQLGLARAAARLDYEGRPIVVWHAPSGRADAAGLAQHAGRAETSLMLHLAPGLVRHAQATAGPEPSVELLRRDGVAAHSPNGVLGDPAGATAEEGAALLDALVADLLGCVDQREPVCRQR